MIECLKGSKKFNIQEKDYTLNWIIDPNIMSSSGEKKTIKGQSLIFLGSGYYFKLK